jgi:hypothetical protein
MLELTPPPDPAAGALEAREARKQHIFALAAAKGWEPDPADESRYWLPNTPWRLQYVGAERWNIYRVRGKKKAGALGVRSYPASQERVITEALDNVRYR